MFFWVARAVLWVLMHILFRVKVTGVEHIPKKGGFIVCSNHLHGFDPVAHAVVVKRRMYFMAKKELFGNIASRLLFRGLGAFPVDRVQTDMRAYKRALAFLKEGKGLLLFAQGTRMAEIDAKSAKAGAAMFAIKTGASIVPAGIETEYKLFSTVRIRYGEAIPTDAYKGQKITAEVIDTLMSSVMTQVQALAAQSV